MFRNEVDQMRFQPECWAPLEGFSRYEISDYGRIRNISRDLIMSTRYNKDDFVIVNLTDDEGELKTKSVATLVAETFIARPSPHCDTVIMKDGNRQNLSVDNIAWRPRWFAMKYHQQLRAPYRELKAPIRVVETLEIFRTVRDMAKCYGLLEDEIISALISGQSIWPYDFHVFLDE